MADQTVNQTAETSARPPANAAQQAKSLRMLALDTREAMFSIAKRISFKAGELIFPEGALTNEFYIIEEGHVVGFRAQSHDGGEGEWSVVRLGPGEILGEMSFLDGGPRQISVRADSDCTLLSFHPFDLLELDNGDHFYDNLRASISVAVVERMRISTEKQIATLKHQIEAIKTQQQFGQFFVYTVALMAIGMIVNNVIANQILKVDIYTAQFAWQYLAVLLVPSYIVVRLMKIPFRQLGLTTQGLRKSLTEGAAISAVIIALTVSVVVASRVVDSIPPIELKFDPVGSVAYLLHSFLQELIGRGLMQSSFQRFLMDEKGIRSVLLSGTLFGVFHIHFGLPAVGLTMLSCFVFGLFYLRHQNLAGVTLLHYAIGACAFITGIL